MHGEGNLLAHLVIVGYKVTYQQVRNLTFLGSMPNLIQFHIIMGSLIFSSLQNPLIEYDFKVTDLFEDLRDGIRLCRVIGLLKHDPSILTVCWI